MNESFIKLGRTFVVTLADPGQSFYIVAVESLGTPLVVARFVVVLLDPF